MSKLEAELYNQLQMLGVAPPEREYRAFAVEVGLGPGVRERLALAGLKDWRLDFCYPSRLFAIEVEGGAYVNGRHNRGKGFEEDLLKYHRAMELGYVVYRCGAKLIKSGEAASLIYEMLQVMPEVELVECVGETKH